VSEVSADVLSADTARVHSRGRSQSRADAIGVGSVRDPGTSGSSAIGWSILTLDGARDRATLRSTGRVSAETTAVMRETISACSDESADGVGRGGSRRRRGRGRRRSGNRAAVMQSAAMVSDALGLSRSAAIGDILKTKGPRKTAVSRTIAELTASRLAMRALKVRRARN